MGAELQPGLQQEQPKALPCSEAAVESQAAKVLGSSHAASHKLRKQSSDVASSGPTSASPDDVWRLSTDSSHSGHYDPRNDVLLTLEAITEKQTRVLLLGMRLTVLVAGVLLVVLADFKLAKPANYLIQHNRLFLINLVGGSVCLALLLYCWVNTAVRIFSVGMLRTHWARRRAYLVTLMFSELSVETINLIFLVADNAYVLAHKCKWFSPATHWLGFVQWTCWNTLFLLLLVLASNARPWLDKHGKPRGSRADATVADAPVIGHAPKLIIWVAFEALLTVAFTVHVPSLRSDARANCESSMQECKSYETTKAISGVLMGLTLFYLLASLLLVCNALRHVQRMPYMDYRMSNIALRLQLKLRTPGIAIFIASLICLALIDIGSCRTELFIYLGLLPMHVAQTGICVAASCMARPTAMKGDNVVLQVWLQEGAWCEKDIPRRKAIRRSCVPDNAALDEEPMFCFETALKMHYWSGLVYTFQEDTDPEALEQAEGVRSLDLAMRLYDLQHYELIWERKLDTKCLVAWSDKVIVVAFRGTASMANACADLRFCLHAHPPKRGLPLLTRPMVHSGFLASWLTNGLNQRVVDCIKRVLSSQAVDRDSFKVIVTGHSLGGALATEAAYDIRQYCGLGVHNLFCITFGAPRTGNHAFAVEYEAVVPHTWHVINDQDLVTRKGKMVFMYKRAGQRVLINTLGDLIVRPSWIEVSIRQRGEGNVKQHHLVSYEAALIAICKGQFGKKGSPRGMRGVLDLLESEPVRKVLELGGLDADTIHQLERQAKMHGTHDPRLAPITKRHHGKLARWPLRHTRPNARHISHSDQSWKPSRLRRLDEAAANAAVRAADSAAELGSGSHDLDGFDIDSSSGLSVRDGQDGGLSQVTEDQEPPTALDVEERQEPQDRDDTASMTSAVDPATDTGYQDCCMHQPVEDTTHSRPSQPDEPSVHGDGNSASWRDRLGITAPVQACGNYLRRLLPTEQVLWMSDLAAADAAECTSGSSTRCHASKHHLDGLTVEHGGADLAPARDGRSDVELGEAGFHGKHKEGVQAAASNKV